MKLVGTLLQPARPALETRGWRVLAEDVKQLTVQSCVSTSLCYLRLVGRAAGGSVPMKEAGMSGRPANKTKSDTQF